MMTIITGGISEFTIVPGHIKYKDKSSPLERKSWFYNAFSFRKFQ